MRFTILSILTVTLAGALIFAYDTQGYVVGPMVVLLIGIGLTLIVAGVFTRMQLRLASAITPTLNSRKLQWIVTAICGRTYSVWALHNFGVNHFEAGRVEQARVIFEQVVHLDGSRSAYLLWLAVANYHLGRFGDVVENVSKAIELGNTSHEAFAYRGFSRYATGDPAGALQDFQNVDCSTKEYSSLAWHRAHVHEMHGNWAEAAKDYVLSFELDGNNLAAGIGLARLQACCPNANIRNGDKAVENATNMCVRTDWKDWPAISVLAAAYAEKRDFLNAVKYAEQAHDLTPEASQPERAQRIEQYRNGVPFRLVATSLVLANHSSAIEN